MRTRPSAKTVAACWERPSIERSGGHDACRPRLERGLHRRFGRDLGGQRRASFRRWTRVHDDRVDAATRRDATTAAAARINRDDDEDEAEPRDCRSAPSFDDIHVMALQAREPRRPRPPGRVAVSIRSRSPWGTAVGTSDSSQVSKRRSARCSSFMPCAPSRRGRRGRPPGSRRASRRGRERAGTWRFPRGLQGFRPPR